jgi:hypothetical protein
MVLDIAAMSAALLSVVMAIRFCLSVCMAVFNAMHDAGKEFVSTKAATVTVNEGRMNA